MNHIYRAEEAVVVLCIESMYLYKVFVTCVENKKGINVYLFLEDRFIVTALYVLFTC